MYYNLIILIYSLLFPHPACDMDALRWDFTKIEDKAGHEEFMNKYANTECQTVARPYLIAAKLKEADFVMMPHKKLSMFREGKDDLENFIKDNPNHFEARYIRLMVQWKTPGFLNYKSNMKEDFDFVEENLKISKVSERYKNRIQSNLDKIEKIL